MRGGIILQREFDVAELIPVIREMCIKVNRILPPDVREAIEEQRKGESFETAKTVLDDIIENYHIADETQVPICQDTGLACVFLDVGQDVHLIGDLEAAINEGVRQGYRDGYLRKSVVKDPLRRVNTGDNTPAVIYYRIVPGRQIKLSLATKGFGSENMSQLKMLRPADGIEGVKDFVLKVVQDAGPNACPPIIVGVGIGGNFDRAAEMAKRCLLRPTGTPNPDPFYADLEAELLNKINQLGIGPMGFGGRTSCLAVAIDSFPTHIAGLPVAVNIQCHVARHIEEVI
ncbi:MAG: fumarate hydratase [Eubacteriales bacterium]|nr:fumarate hydratase [Eubacteriales bacterium]